MRLNEATSTVEVGGLAETQAFSINVSGKAFKILLDGLYANKIAAVIRELSTNAYDAHLAIGAGAKAFRVQLPTIWQPTFKVRDYGISMNHADAMRLMSTLFDSTKDQSNTQVGAFGLGSKSPFSIVDTFSLNIFLDGEKRSYSAYFGSNGVPTLALLGREPSSEPRGVEFSLTIDQKDIRAFETNARSILRWFPTIPDVFSGNTPIKISKPGTTAAGKGWSLVTGDGIIGAHARQGCVVYPLNVSAIPGIPPDVASMLAAPIVIDFPIGSLDVVASREALSYDAPTKANIIARLNSVTREIREHFGKTIHDAPTLWEAGTIRNNLVNSSQLPRALIQVIKETKWQGKITPHTFIMGKVKDAVMKDSKIEINPHCWDGYRLRRRAKSLASFDDHSLNWGKTTQIGYGTEDVKFFFTVDGARPKHESRRLGMFANSGGRMTQILVTVLDSEASLQTVLDAMGNPPHNGWTKDLPEPASTPRAAVAKRGTTKKVEVKARKVIFDPGFPCTLEPEQLVNLDGTAVYAITLAGNITGLGDQKTDSAHVNTFLDSLAQVDRFEPISKLPVYVISSTYQKRLEAFVAEGGAWTSIQDVVAGADLTLRLQDALLKEAILKNIRKFSLDSPWVKMLKDSPIARKLALSLPGGGLHDLMKAYTDLNLPFEPYPNMPLTLHKGLYGFRLFGVNPIAIREAVEEELGNDPVLTRLYGCQNACIGSYPMVSNHHHNDYKSADLLRYIEAIAMLENSERQARMAERLAAFEDYSALAIAA